MKCITLFQLTNLAVIVTLSVVAYPFGLKYFIGTQGLNSGTLLAFAISKWSANTVARKAS